MIPNDLHGTRGEDGVTEFVLEAREARVDLGHRTARLYTYNGTFPGPTLRATEGDRVRIVFRNGLSERTNLHLHGMPMPPAVDAPHRALEPGETRAYEFTIPEGVAGTCWYHPHVHGEVAWQLGSGLAGAMVISGREEAAGALRGVTERVLVLQDLSLDGERPRLRTPMEMHDGREGELVLVNGRSAPTLDVPAGLVRLRVVNASCARFYDLCVEGAGAHLLGLDAHLLDAPVAVGALLLPPGQRADLLVRAEATGTITLRDRPYHRGVLRLPGMRGTPRPNDGVLARLAVRGASTPAPTPARLRPVERLDPRDAVATRVLEYGGEGGVLRLLGQVARGQRFGYGEGDRGAARFAFNGRSFAADRVDHEVTLGTMEVWELRNPTSLDHPFHLHIHPFQVLDIDGEAPAFAAWRDVVNVPAGRVVRVLVPFRAFPGVTMFHCHILEHEDNGMMGHVRVVDPTAPDRARHGCG